MVITQHHDHRNPVGSVAEAAAHRRLGLGWSPPRLNAPGNLSEFVRVQSRVMLAADRCLHSWKHDWGWRTTGIEAAVPAPFV